MVHYLLIQWVMLPIASVEVEVSILAGNLVSHGTFKGAVIDQRHHWQKMVRLGGNKQVVGSNDSNIPSVL